MNSFWDFRCCWDRRCTWVHDLIAILGVTGKWLWAQLQVMNHSGIIPISLHGCVSDVSLDSSNFVVVCFPPWAWSYVATCWALVDHHTHLKWPALWVGTNAQKLLIVQLRRPCISSYASLAVTIFQVEWKRFHCSSDINNNEGLYRLFEIWRWDHGF